MNGSEHGPILTKCLVMIKMKYGSSNSNDESQSYLGEGRLWVKDELEREHLSWLVILCFAVLSPISRNFLKCRLLCSSFLLSLLPSFLFSFFLPSFFLFMYMVIFTACISVNHRYTWSTSARIGHWIP